MRQFPDLGQGGIGVGAELARQLGRPSYILVEEPVQDADLHPERDQALLGSVMKVPLEGPAGPAFRVGHLGIGQGELGLRLVALQSDPRTRRDRLQQGRLLQQSVVVHDGRQRVTCRVARDRDGLAGGGRGRILVERTRGVDPPTTVRQPVGDLQAGVLQRVGHDETQLSPSGRRWSPDTSPSRAAAAYRCASSSPNAIDSGTAQNSTTSTRPESSEPPEATNTATARVRRMETTNSGVSVRRFTGLACRSRSSRDRAVVTRIATLATRKLVWKAVAIAGASLTMSALGGQSGWHGTNGPGRGTAAEKSRVGIHSAVAVSAPAATITRSRARRR